MTSCTIELCSPISDLSSGNLLNSSPGAHFDHHIFCDILRGWEDRGAPKPRCGRPPVELPPFAFSVLRHWLVPSRPGSVSACRGSTSAAVCWASSVSNSGPRTRWTQQFLHRLLRKLAATPPASRVRMTLPESVCNPVHRRLAHELARRAHSVCALLLELKFVSIWEPRLQTGRSSVALRVLVAHHLRRHRTRTRAITQRFREPCWFNMTVPRAHHFRHISVSPLVIAPTLPHAGCCVVLPMFPHTSVFAETTCVFAAGPFSGEFSTRIHCSTQVCPKQRFQATLLGGLRILKSPEVNDLPCGKCDPMRIDDNTSGFILLKRLPGRPQLFVRWFLWCLSFCSDSRCGTLSLSSHRLASVTSTLSMHISIHSSTATCFLLSEMFHRCCTDDRQFRMVRSAKMLCQFSGTHVLDGHVQLFIVSCRTS